MKEIFKKRNNGITLIALVVTVVVLLILAGISIKVLTGENGIIGQAKQAKEDSIIGDEKESIGVAYVRCEGDNKTGTNVTDSQMEQALIQDGKDVKVITEEGDLEVTFNDTKHKYIIDEEGNIEKVKDLTPEEANKIVDVVYYCEDQIYVLTAGREVREAYRVSGEIFDQLEVAEEGDVITKKGVKKKGNGWFIDNKGKVYTWGYNKDGELGDGTTTSSRVPICISEKEGNVLKGKNIVEISARYSYKVAIDNEGKVYTWGYNGYGQLGDGTTTSSGVPICISEKEGNVLKGKNIVEISAGDYHTVAIDEEGKVYTWGYNDYGQLGDGTTTSSGVPICISEKEGNVLKGKNIVEISAGYYHTVAIDEEGKVYTWGYNYYGQLGDGTTTSSGVPICISEKEGNVLNGKKIVEISAERNHTVAIDSEGKVYTWGYNYYGQLGDGTEEDSDVPICISEKEGNVLKGKNIVEISAGDYHTVAIDNEGKIYTWGHNGYGQLGDGTTTSSAVPICISDIPYSDIYNLQIKKMGAETTITNVIDFYCIYYIAENNQVYVYLWVALKL